MVGWVKVLGEGNGPLCFQEDGDEVLHNGEDVTAPWDCKRTARTEIILEVHDD
jgi:hypothetical protein